MIIVDQRSETFLLALPRRCVHFLSLLLYQSHSGLRYAVFKVKCWCCKSLRRGYAEVPSAFSDAGSIVECHSGCFHFSCWEGLRWWMMSCVFFPPHSHTFFSCFVFPQSEFHTVTLFLMCSFLHLFCSTPASLLLYTQRKHSQSFKYECSNLPSVLI